MLKAEDRTSDGVTVIDLKGQIDGGPESPKLHEIVKECLEQGHKRLVVNMQGVRWLNSLGVGILVAAYTSAKREEVTLKLYGVSERVRVVIDRVVPGLFEIFDSEQNARESF